MSTSGRLRISGGPYYTIEAPPLPGAGAAREPDLLAVARRNILTWLEQVGEAPLAEIPRSWPVTRFLMRHAARRLEAEGLVVRIVDPTTGPTGAWALARREEAQGR